MKKNCCDSICHSQKVMSEYIISDEMRDLIVRYMTAINEEDHATAEELLHKIKLESAKS